MNVKIKWCTFFDNTNSTNPVKQFLKRIYMIKYDVYVCVYKKNNRPLFSSRLNI